MADLPGRVSDRGRAGQEVCVAPSRIPRITPATNPSVPIGVIIPNRDRVAPMWNTLSGLQGQTLCPKWVTIADLGSSEEGAPRRQRQLGRTAAIEETGGVCGTDAGSSKEDLHKGCSLHCLAWRNGRHP